MRSRARSATTDRICTSVVYCGIKNIQILITVAARDPGFMKKPWTIAVALALVSGSAGCGSELATEPAATPAPTPAATPATAPSVTGPVVVTPETGFPCDVHAVLQATCASCHAGRLYYGPNFDSRADMFRPATELFLVQSKPVAPGTLGEHVAVALREQTMPPYGALAMPTPAESALVIAWVESGMPGGACGGLSSTP
jgi:hypothetical protein